MFTHPLEKQKQRSGHHCAETLVNSTAAVVTMVVNFMVERGRREILVEIRIGTVHCIDSCTNHRLQPAKRGFQDH